MRGWSCLVVAIGVAGCSGSVDSSPLLSVGGSYQTAVTLLEATCVDPVLEQHATTVTHTPGSASLTLTHAGSTYAGSVTGAGTFSVPTVTQVFSGVTFEIRIAGTFTLTAMTARVDVARTTPPACTFAAQWSGPKSGPPNVIP